jgi:hypothetical protein
VPISSDHFTEYFFAQDGDIVFDQAPIPIDTRNTTMHNKTNFIFPLAFFVLIGSCPRKAFLLIADSKQIGRSVFPIQILQ